jgi:hypothetical protein
MSHIEHLGLLHTMIVNDLAHPGMVPYLVIPIRRKIADSE